MITIPTLSELRQQVTSDLENEFGESLPTFGKNALRIIASVWSASLWILYTFLAKIQKNIWVDTADPESSGGTLERFGRIKLGRDPFPARAGQYDVTVTGSIAAVIPSGTTFKSDDDSANPGKLFVLDVEHTMVTASDTINLRALEAGLDSQLEIGNTLTSTSPINSVNSQVTVTAETVAPLAAESIDDYREKAEQSYRLESQGGASADYIIWSFDAQGVAGVYPYAKTSASNEINVFIEATIVDSTDGKGTPSQSILDEVADVIELDPDVTLDQYERGRRPLGVFAVNVLPIVVNQIDIEINDSNFTTNEETAIFNALEAEIEQVRPFIAGADVLEEKNDTLDNNKIVSVILEVVPGASFGTVTLRVNSLIVPSKTFINGDIPFLETVIYP